MDASLQVRDAAVLASLLGAAVSAPSSHNTQPWLFRATDSVVELWADRSRALPVNDPHGRELTISCGAALFSLQLAAARAGIVAHTDVLPRIWQPDLLARVHLSGAVRESESALFDSLHRRRTHRQRFSAAPVTTAAVDALTAAAADEGAWMAVIPDDGRRRTAAALVAEGDAAQWSDPAWRRELAAWMRPYWQRDGLSLPALAIPVARMAVRNLDLGRRVGRRDQRLAVESPLLAVLGTAGDAAADWLAAGRALQRLLLVAVQQGLQASYLNQPIQVAALRPRLQQLLGRPGQPQLFLRLGVPGRNLPATPRRPLNDVVKTE